MNDFNSQPDDVAPTSVPSPASTTPPAPTAALDPDTTRDPIEVIADEFVERQRRGETPAIEEYAERYPHLADAIRELFPTIAAVERLKVAKQRSSGGRATLRGAQLERLGDFRIIREIGRGGMGIVYEAEQESLGRHVAVKVLPRQVLLDAKQLRRFEREARTAAQLHHTNIVPVFGVGEHDGFHYIVMQYIDGVGLEKVLLQLKGEDPASFAELLETIHGEKALSGAESGEPSGELPAGGFALSSGAGSTYWHNVARIGRQVAEALHYAHQQGTLHRDIKPANLLLDPQGVVWVADFGLAKALEHDDVSQTGDIVGTLRYMAPEQLQGHPDARSDVYSLGLTLYELVTMQPAIDAPTHSELLRQVMQHEPVLPRKINPSIPHDLETIILKSIEREPDQRYQTAGQFAADLQCFLQDRPVHARRVSQAERLWRWCRRNRAVASLAGTALLLLVLVAVVASVGYLRTKAALDDVSAERERYAQTSQLATEALDRIFQHFAPDRRPLAAQLTIESDEGEQYQVPVQPVLSSEAAAILESMLVYYDKLAEQAGGDIRFLRKSAEANRRVGDIRQQLGDSLLAKEAYERAIEKYEQLGDESRSDEQVVTEIARIHNELGNVAREPTSDDQAWQSHFTALRILQSLNSTAPEVRFELARTYYFLGRRLGVGPGGSGRGPGRGRPSSRPGDGGGRPDSRERGGDANRTDGRRFDDAPPLNKAIELLTALQSEFPKVPEYRHLLALCYREQPAGSDDSHAEAIAVFETLAKDFPTIPEYRFDLCQTYGMIDVRRLPDEQIAAAETELSAALEIARDLVAERPNVPRYVYELVQTHQKLADLQRKSAKYTLAEANLESARKLQATLVERFPEAMQYRFRLGWIKNMLIDVLREQDKLDEARTLAESTIAELEASLAADEDNANMHFPLWDAYRVLARICNDQGDEATRQHAEAKSAEHWKSVPRRPPSRRPGTNGPPRPRA